MEENMTTELYQPLIERVQQMPGVQATSLTTAAPLGKRVSDIVNVRCRRARSGVGPNEDLVAQFRAVGLGLQRVFGFRMLSEIPTGNPRSMIHVHFRAAIL
jgi:hypothetical protein